MANEKSKIINRKYTLHNPGKYKINEILFLMNTLSLKVHDVP